MKQKTLGLALGAGGARGIAHISFLKVLVENGIEVGCISGSSMGAVIGSMYAAGLSCDEMEKKALSIKARDIIDIDLLFFRKNNFIKGVKRESILKSYLGGKTFSDCKIPFCCTAVDIMTGDKIILKDGPLLPAVLASSSIPSVFAPIEIDGRYLVDGGVLMRLPIEPLKQFNPDIIVAVDVLGDSLTGILPKNIFYTLIRTINIMDCEITRFYSNQADLLINIDQPEVDQFMVKNLDKSLDAGRAAAERALPKIKRLLGIKN